MGPELFRVIAMLTLMMLLPGCATLHWYGHLAEGQARLLLGRQPISELLGSDRTEPELQIRLAEAQRILEFARERLHLPVKGQYSHYVDTGREHAVWALFAAPEFSLQPKEWCYPLIGCASYRGFFNRDLAESARSRLNAKQYDTWIGGVRAYSTLGWFDDPLLNTFVNLESSELAALLFHELAHLVVFVPGDTGFNESFASFVEQEGLRQWLEAQNRVSEWDTYLANESMRERFHTMVTDTSRKLERLYQSDLPADLMRRSKMDLFDSLKEAYVGVTETHPEFKRYAGWFKGPLNNAKLSTVRTYQGRVQAFAQLFSDSGRDFLQFYAAVRKIAELDEKLRHAALPEKQK